MKQYCRYCSSAIATGDDVTIYCEKYRKTKSKGSCLTVNKCKKFEFNELDVFDLSKKYKPSKPKEVSGTQIKMEVPND